MAVLNLLNIVRKISWTSESVNELGSNFLSPLWGVTTWDTELNRVKIIYKNSMWNKTDTTKK